MIPLLKLTSGKIFRKVLCKNVFRFKIDRLSQTIFGKPLAFAHFSLTMEFRAAILPRRNPSPFQAENAALNVE